MKPKKMLERILEGREVTYGSPDVYRELLQDLAALENITKDTRTFTNDDITAANAEIRLKWKSIEPELSVYLSASRKSEQIKAKSVLQKRLLQLYREETEPPQMAVMQATSAVVPEKTTEERIKERAAKREEKRTAKSAPAKESAGKPPKTNNKPPKDK